MPNTAKVKFKPENDCDRDARETDLRRDERAIKLKRRRRERERVINEREWEARVALAREEMELSGMELDVSQEDARQILETYNAVVADGRYVSMLQCHPQAAAQLVGKELSDKASTAILRAGRLSSAIDYIRVGGVAGEGDGDPDNSIVYVICIAVIVVVMEVTIIDRDFVLDHHGHLKY